MKYFKTLIGTGVGCASIVAMAGLALDVDAHPVQGVLYYTIYQSSADQPNVKQVEFNYDGATLTLGTLTGITHTPGADGLIFAPDGDLLVGGQGCCAYKVSPTGSHPIYSASAPSERVFHLMMDPDNTRFWAADYVSSELTEFPLSVFPGGSGTTKQVVGDDGTVTTVAFDASSKAYYTTGGEYGNGNFGVIDLGVTPAVTTRALSSVPASHGMIYDPYTEDLLLFGDGHVTQIDPTLLQVVSDLDLSTLGVPIDHVDQGSADGNGHVFVADHGGRLIFIDFSVSRLVGDPSNFRAAPFLENYLDDFAPLVGPGGPTTPTKNVSWGRIKALYR